MRTSIRIRNTLLRLATLALAMDRASGGDADRLVRDGHLNERKLVRSFLSGKILGAQIGGTVVSSNMGELDIAGLALASAAEAATLDVSIPLGWLVRVIHSDCGGAVGQEGDSPWS